MKQWTINDFQRELEQDEQYTCSTYTAGVKIGGGIVRINMQLENCEPNDQAQYISSTASQHINWIVSNIENIRTHLADKMTSLANDWAEEGEITAEEFKERVQLEAIRISATGESDANIPIEDGNLVLYFYDDDIFAGHSIELWVHKGYVLDDDPTIAG